MIVFDSSSKENIYKAKAINKWQCKREPHKIKHGDSVFIKANNDIEIIFLGNAERITEETLINWPDGWEKNTPRTTYPTIYFRKIELSDFNPQGQCPFRYANDNRQTLECR